MPRGYTTHVAVAAELNTTFTSPQAQFCDTLIAECEAWVDGETDRQWLVPSPIAGELHRVEPQGVFLQSAPVASITAVTVRGAAVTTAPTTLVAGRDYELLSAAQGLVWLAGRYVGWLASVDYAPVLATTSPAVGPPVPADLSGAVRRIVAEWLRQPLGLPRPAGAMSAYSIGSDLRVEYATNPALQFRTIPPAEQAIIARYKPLVVLV